MVGSGHSALGSNIVTPTDAAEDERAGEAAETVRAGGSGTW